MGDNDEKKTDHDLLIKLNTKMTQICNENKEIKTDIKEIYRVMAEQKACCAMRISSCKDVFEEKDDANDKMNKALKIFTLIVLIFAGIVGGSYTVSYWNSEKIHALESKVDKHSFIHPMEK